MLSSLLLAFSALLGSRIGPTLRPAVTDGMRPAPSPWVTVNENAAIRASIDTSRVERTANGVLVWIAFDLTEAWPPMESIRAPYKHFESHAEIACSTQRTRGRGMRFVDVKGGAYREPSPDSTWVGFAQHPMRPELFVATCEKLAALHLPRDRRAAG